MPRLLSSLVLGLITALSLSCSRQAGTLDQGENLQNNTLKAPVPSELMAGLPDVSTLRSSSVLVAYQRDGADTFARDIFSQDEGSSIRLDSPSLDRRYAVWGFGNAAGATDCIVDYDGPNQDGAYFAIANFETGRWEVAGPVPGPQQDLAIDKSGYISGLGDFFVAMITYDGANVLVDQLLLVVDVAPISTEIDNSGGYPSLAVVDGNPAISYYDDVNHDLKFVRATDAFGGSWAAPVTVDSTGDTGQHTSLAVVEGVPAIAYYDFTNKDLRYSLAQDSVGSSWNAPVTVDGAARQTGEFCSLLVVNGQPAISYYDAEDSELRYVRATDSGGFNWGTKQSVDNAGNTGQDTCLALVNGLPAISYRDGGAGTLRYVNAMDVDGAAWDVPQILASGNNTGFSSSIQIVDGNPAISFYDNTDSNLLYIRALDAAGTNWDTALTLAGFDDASGDYCSMAIIQGFAVIAYYNGLFGDLRFVRSLDTGGQSWTEPVVLDESSVVTGKDPSLLEVAGHAGVAYYDQTNGKLRYMWGFGED